MTTALDQMSIGLYNECITYNTRLSDDITHQGKALFDRKKSEVTIIKEKQEFKDMIKTAT